MPKISVLMPVYKTPEAYLKAAIESILAQTFGDFEFLILDDCPQDDRQKILVICSFSDKNRKYKAPDGFYLDRGKLILCNYPNGEPDVLRPYETRVYLW